MAMVSKNILKPLILVSIFIYYMSFILFYAYGLEM